MSGVLVEGNWGQNDLNNAVRKEEWQNSTREWKWKSVAIMKEVKFTVDRIE